MKSPGEIEIYCPTPLRCRQGGVVDVWATPFLKKKNTCFTSSAWRQLRVGQYIGGDAPLFLVKDIDWREVNGLSQKVFCLQIMQDRVLSEGNHSFHFWSEGYTLAVITLSDKGFMGEREDTAGSMVEHKIREGIPLTLSFRSIIGDEPHELLSLLVHYGLTLKTDLIITTGGTGLTTRDITPEVTLRILERRLEGFEHMMFAEGIKKTPHAIISRAVCGTLAKSLILNLPGSPRAVSEALDSLLPALPHALEKLMDDPSPCALTDMAHGQ